MGAPLVYAPPTPSLPSLQVAPQLTPLVRRTNASILCLLPNIVSSLCPQHSVVANCSLTLCPLHLRRWRSFWQPLTDSATGPDGISSRVLKSCSAALAHPSSTLLTLSFALVHLLSAWKSASVTVLHKKLQKRIPLTTNL